MVKLYRGPAENPLFPNDPTAEAKLLQLLESTSLAPKLLAEIDCDDGRCNLYTHLPGQQWREGTASVGDLMRQLHQIAPPGTLRNTPSGSAALREKTVSILARCAENGLLKALEPNAFVSPSQHLRLLHGDIVPGNLILNETGLHLIDWQCPAVGDPCEDIAIFLSPAMQSLYRGAILSGGEVSAFFDAYAQEGVSDRYRALAPWYHWRMAAYCQWQSENGQPDYLAARDLEVEALQRSASL